MFRKSQPSVLQTQPASRRTFLQGAGAVAGAAALGGLVPAPLRAQETFIWYTGIAVEASDDVSKSFTAKTGIPVEYFRAGSNNLAQKFEQEVKADQVRCSAVAITNPTLVARWAKEGLVMPYDSPEFANYGERFVIKGFAGPTHGEPHIMAYNTELVSAEDAPKIWEDLLDPKWKGKIVMTDGGSSASALHWYAALKTAKGPEFMEQLAAQDVLIKTGGAEVGNSLVSGERLVAAMITQGHASRAIGAGGPLRIVIPEEGAPLLFTVVFVPAKAPNPDVGKQFLDHILSEESQLMLENKHFSSSLRNGMTRAPSDTGGKPLAEVTPIHSSPEDLDKFAAEAETLAAEYTELFK